MAGISNFKNSLSDISSECFILILQLRSINDFGDYEILKSKIYEMLDKFDRDARNNNIDYEKVKYAKFALAAFLDETIISSSWNQKHEWLAEPLQMKLFNTFNAGEEFFSNINLIREKISTNKDVLEVYYLCLTLGFKGKFQFQSPESIRRVIDDLNMELHPQMFKAIDEISPNAKPRENFVQSAVKSRIPLWIFPLCAVILCIIFYLIMSSSITGQASDVVTEMKNFM